jgi:CPA2 family monovalent cation:H+ antiporter-2
MHGEVVRGLIVDIMIVLASGLVAGMICRRLNISMLIGYLTVGVLIGHGGLGLIADRDHYLEELAHAGALFLLFSVGIEFSVDHLRKMSRYIVVGGSLQMILVAVPLVIACRIDGLSWPAAALAGSAGALSSTILVFKALSEVGQATAPHGRRAMGILLFQDLALVPMLLLVPLLTGTGESPDVMTFVLLAAKSVLFLVCVYVTRIITSRFLIDLVAGLRSVEVVTLFAVCLLGFAGLLADLVGLPSAVGALAAGVILSGQRLSQQADTVLLPFREMFSVVFFVTLGMLLEPTAFLAEPLLLTVGFLAMVSLKTGAATVALRATGLDWKSSFGMGMGLSQLGEFSFLLVATGVSAGLIDAKNYNRMLFIAIASLIATPQLLRRGLRLVTNEWNEAVGGEEVLAFSDERPLALVVGLGPIGQRAVGWLTAANYHVCLVDLSPVNLYRYAQQGFHTVAGDAADQRILDLAHIERAAIVLVTVPRDDIALQVIASVKQARPDLVIFARCRFAANVPNFEKAGATAVISEEVEAAHRFEELCERQLEKR